MKTLVIIPSRLSASRLPGKPLLKINGISIISHVYKKAQEAEEGTRSDAFKDLVEALLNDTSVTLTKKFIQFSIPLFYSFARLC